MVYETIWNAQSLGAPATKSHSAPEERLQYCRSGSTHKHFLYLCLPMASSFQEKRRQGSDSHTSFWTPPKAQRKRDQYPSGHFVGRGIGIWFSKRLVDSEAHSSCDPEGVRCQISSMPYLENSERLWLELPSSRTSGLAAR